MKITALLENTTIDTALTPKHGLTCHCTGKTAFEIMRGIMDDNIHYLSTGSVIEL